MSIQSEFGPRPWMSKVLLAAALYNTLWGLCVILFPTASLSWAGFDTPVDYPQIWQCVGMIVGVYGIGYAIAATDPFRHWPITLVGLLGKIFGPIGFATGFFSGTLPGSMAWTLLFNDLIWWPPFAIILWSAFRYHQVTMHDYAVDIFDDDPVHSLVSTTGQNLHQLSMVSPQLVVFLRHSGCTFCREAMADLGQQREDIEKRGCGIVLVLVGAGDETDTLLKRNSLTDLPRIHDPHCRLYQQFGLELGNYSQLFGWKVCVRSVIAGIINGHGVGAIAGNPLQMPGVFVVHGGRFLKGFQHTSAADRPSYSRLVSDAISSGTMVSA